MKSVAEYDAVAILHLHLSTVLLLDLFALGSL